jgi:dimethylhistidine N-methyltransferase
MSTRHSAASQTADATKDFVGDVEYYLTLQPRQLPSRYFYDALGSALFDAICELPWYRITRAELGLLERYGQTIFAHAGAVSRIVELGPGNGAKLKTLVEAARPRRRGLALHLIDVSPTALDRAARALDMLDGVSIVTHASTYEVGLADVASETDVSGRTLALFLGSNIGNFDRPGGNSFLREFRGALGRGDTLLVGADLVKPEPELRLAYDDPLGVTAAFNRNLLVRINRELDGAVDLDGFAHRVIWNETESRVEMHLVSLRRQRVSVPAAHVDFMMDEGETIWTESSYKYHPAGVVAMLEEAGFRAIEQWVDTANGFALTLVGVA